MLSEKKNAVLSAGGIWCVLYWRPPKQEAHCTEAYIKPSPSYYGDDIFYDYSTLSKPVHIGTLLLTRLQTLFSFYHILTGVYLCAFPF